VPLREKDNAMGIGTATEEGTDGSDRKLTSANASHVEELPLDVLPTVLTVI